MERTIISKVKVLEVYPDAICTKIYIGSGYYKVTTKNKNYGGQITEAKAWNNAWQVVRSEIRENTINEAKKINSIRIKPTIKAAIISKHGSVQKWVDAMSKDFLTK